VRESERERKIERKGRERDTDDDETTVGQKKTKYK
jgi:hypothetical protein